MWLDWDSSAKSILISFYDLGVAQVSFLMVVMGTISASGFYCFFRLNGYYLVVADSMESVVFVYTCILIKWHNSLSWLHEAPTRAYIIIIIITIIIIRISIIIRIIISIDFNSKLLYITWVENAYWKIVTQCTLVEFVS